MADTDNNLVPDSPEYIEKMAALGESAVNQGKTHGGEEPPAEPPTDEPKEIPSKPDFVPDKFYNKETGEVNYEALAKSYAELEKAKSKPKAEDKPPEPPADAKANTDADKDTQDEANKAVEAAGLDMSLLSQEFEELGELSEASYEALNKVGIPKGTVDSYIAGQQALAEVARQQAFGITEGEGGYKSMVSWAKANLSAEEINAFNSQINTVNKGVRETAIRGLWSRYTADTGTSKPLVSGKTTGLSSGGFESAKQMSDAINDPRYRDDPAYRETVAKKIANSSF